jgi:lupus La protein
VPYIKHEKGESSGLLGFDKELSEEDIAFVKETLKGQGGDSVVWSIAGGEPPVRSLPGAA